MKKALIFLILALTLTLPAYAAGGMVEDEAGILTAAELSGLEERAQGISQAHDCGVYIITVWDFGGGDVYDYAVDAFNRNGLGFGDDREGILLLLSMAQRDYALVIHGERANTAIDADGQDRISGDFLDDFRDNRWADGFYDYLECCEAYLSAAENGQPIQEENGSGLVKVVVILALSLLAAGITCGVFYSRMKTARTQTTATPYISGDGLQLTTRQDIFTHRTESRRTIETDAHSGSGSHHSGGGFSGKSGKF